MADNTNREPGVVGAHVGPNAGTTPQDDADLHSGENPYGNGLGSPPYDLTRPLAYGIGVDAVNRTAQDVARQNAYDVAAPYFRNPPAAGGNPWAQASALSKSEAGDRAASADVAAGLDAVYVHTVHNYVGGDPAEVNFDEGFGRTGAGRS